MESTTFPSNASTEPDLLGMFTMAGTGVQNISTTRMLPTRTSHSEDDADAVFLWMPLIFVVVFAVIVVSLIILSRFSFRSRCCDDDHRRRDSRGEYCEFVHFYLVCWQLDLVVTLLHTSLKFAYGCLDYSYLVPSVDYSYLERFIPWTIRTVGGLFVPWTIYTVIGLFIP